MSIGIFVRQNRGYQKREQVMTRAQLIATVAEKTQVSTKTCDMIIRKFLDTISEEVAAGEKITISGFGTFERKRWKASLARNPQTGEPMEIESQNVAVIRAGSGLKHAVKARDSHTNRPITEGFGRILDQD